MNLGLPLLLLRLLSDDNGRWDHMQWWGRWSSMGDGPGSWIALGGATVQLGVCFQHSLELAAILHEVAGLPVAITVSVEVNITWSRQ
jgi:hypothetical protein